VKEKHTLYRFFDRSKSLLYVGISCSALRRFLEHKSEKSWWSEISHSTLEHFETRQEALDAERAAIRNEKPKYNKIHNGAGGAGHVDDLDEAAKDLGVGLVGRFFHTEIDGPGQQGRVVAQVGADLFLAQLYEWMLGQPTQQVIYRLEEMVNWTFYEDAESWRNDYEHGQVGSIRHRLIEEDAKAANWENGDPLLRVHPHAYFEALSGTEVSKTGEAECPVCGTSRCLVFQNSEAGWWCGGCQVGGDIYDLACHIWKIKKDRSFSDGQARWLGLRSVITKKILECCSPAVEREDADVVGECAQRYADVSNGPHPPTSGSIRADAKFHEWEAA
jgi:predicted GIY-YIG superfamily endonuclease